MLSYRQKNSVPPLQIKGHRRGRSHWVCCACGRLLRSKIPSGGQSISFALFHFETGTQLGRREIPFLIPLRRCGRTLGPRQPRLWPAHWNFFAHFGAFLGVAYSGSGKALAYWSPRHRIRDCSAGRPLLAEGHRWDQTWGVKGEVSLCRASRPWVSLSGDFGSSGIIAHVCESYVGSSSRPPTVVQAGASRDWVLGKLAPQDPHASTEKPVPNTSPSEPIVLWY